MASDEGAATAEKAQIERPLAILLRDAQPTAWELAGDRSAKDNALEARRELRARYLRQQAKGRIDAALLEYSRELLDQSRDSADPVGTLEALWNPPRKRGAHVKDDRDLRIAADIEKRVNAGEAGEGVYQDLEEISEHNLSAESFKRIHLQQRRDPYTLTAQLDEDRRGELGLTKEQACEAADAFLRDIEDARRESDARTMVHQVVLGFLRTFGFDAARTTLAALLHDSDAEASDVILAAFFTTATPLESGASAELPS